MNPASAVPVDFAAFGAFAASWEVHEVTLVASTLAPAGARYEVIGRYGLGLSTDCA